MSPTRRLRGVAAFSAAALATAGLAGTGLAADECTDEDCVAENVTLNFMREMMVAQGMPEETIDQTMAMYEQMGLFDGDGGFADAFLKGEATDQVAPANDQVAPGTDDEATASIGLREMIAAFGGEGIPEETMALIEQMYAQGDAFDKMEEVFGKVEIAQPGEEAFTKITWAEDQALSVAETALMQAAAAGDIDQATLNAILELLPDE